MSHNFSKFRFNYCKWLKFFRSSFYAESETTNQLFYLFLFRKHENPKIKILFASFYLQKQWAAVKIHLLLTTTPPQLWIPWRSMETTQGNSPGLAWTPPMILVPLCDCSCLPQKTSETKIDLLIIPPKGLDMISNIKWIRSKISDSQFITAELHILSTT